MASHGYRNTGDDKIKSPVKVPAAYGYQREGMLRDNCIHRSDHELSPSKAPSTNDSAGGISGVAR
jgi:hypothetical protein